ncbi:tRNA(His) guanylyltransferase Thg1 family protein [Nannocystaceae bacterium ST9]
MDTKMREFEGLGDDALPDDHYLIARLDGRGFTTLTKQRLDLARPFDARMRDAMIATARHLMQCGFAVSYAYTQSDEISLWFGEGERSFGRKPRKWFSVLAGEASARFTAALAELPRADAEADEGPMLGVFDCRLILLPGLDDVVDYFRWRQQDATRNAMIGHVYWQLRASGLSARRATREMEGLGHAALGQRLAGFGVDFDARPTWERHGVGLAWTEVEAEGVDPRTGARTIARRRRIALDLELPTGPDYSAWLRARRASTPA